MSQKEQPYSEEVPEAPEDPIANLMKSIGEISPTLGPSLAAFFGGIALLLDDAHDFGKFGDERDPPMPHHWLWGCLLMMGGTIGLGMSMLNFLAANPEAAEGLRKKIEEAAMAKRVLSPEALEELFRKQVF